MTRSAGFLNMGFTSRLVRDIREGDDSAGALSKVWDFDMKDREAEFKEDLREASGVGKKRGRKVRSPRCPCLAHITTIKIAWQAERGYLVSSG